MPRFDYQATDQQGQLHKGNLEAESVAAARSQLRSRSLIPLVVNEAKASLLQTALRRSLAAGDLAFVTRQIASLLAAGLPLERVLQAVIDQTEKPTVKTILESIKKNLQEGHTFAHAISQFPRDFSVTYRALITAGEASRDLALVMNKLADYVEARNALRQKMVQAFTYPAIVSVMSVAIVMFLLGYVVPQIAAVFTANKQSLPLLTRMMLALSDFVRSYGLETLLLLLLLWLGARFALRRDGVRLQWHQLLLRLPVVGRLVRGFNTSQFASTLAILFSAGVPILVAMQVARNTMNNSVLKRAVDNSLVKVREGSGVARALSGEGGFSPTLLHLIRFGEESGELAQMLERAATGETKELERRTLLLTSLLEPILVLVMGGVVLTIVLAVLLPIIEVNQIIR